MLSLSLKCHFCGENHKNDNHGFLRIHPIYDFQIFLRKNSVSDWPFLENW